MNISTRLNRDFYVKMRIKGYTHDVITSNVFPPERFDSFCDDIKGLDDIDYTKKIDINKVIDKTEEIKKDKNKNK